MPRGEKNAARQFFALSCRAIALTKLKEELKPSLEEKRHFGRQFKRQPGAGSCKSKIAARPTKSQFLLRGNVLQGLCAEQATGQPAFRNVQEGANVHFSNVHFVLCQNLAFTASRLPSMLYCFHTK